MRVISKEIVTILYDHTETEEAQTALELFTDKGYKLISKSEPIVAPYQNKIIMEIILSNKEDSRF